MISARCFIAAATPFLAPLVLAALIAMPAPCADAGHSVTNRAQAVKALCEHLGIGPGSVVADVGCGDGPDTLVFAEVVGERGTVFAQEIELARLKKVIESADKRGFHQVVAVLGQSDDPRLPDASADLIYMNRVFHHFARPREMLQRLWADLKPGGFLVIVDQEKGPLTDWAPLESREKQHHWTGETAVVRLAREAGFLFHDVLDDRWHEKAPFVLAFRRPDRGGRIGADPEAPRAFDPWAVARALPLGGVANRAVIFCGLDGGRYVLPGLRNQLPAGARLVDVIPEEWMITRNELPLHAPWPGVEILRTDKGTLPLPDGIEPGLVVVMDAYHRLWNPGKLLTQLRQRLPASGQVVVVDRVGPEGESRRVAGHWRRIAPAQVIADMAQAGFSLQRTVRAPVRDRFFLVFGVAEGASTRPTPRAR